MMYSKIENEISYVRDPNCNGIVNIDNDALYAYKQKKKAQRDLVNDVAQLKNDMAEIRNLLNQLVDRL